MIKMHFSEIKSEAGNSFVNLARASILFETQHHNVPELFCGDNFMPECLECQPRRSLFKRRQCPKFAHKGPPCMSVIHGIHAEKLVPLNLPRSSYTAH